jgi:hypothetical protein
MRGKNFGDVFFERFSNFESVLKFLAKSIEPLPRDQEFPKFTQFSCPRLYHSHGFEKKKKIN